MKLIPGISLRAKFSVMVALVIGLVGFVMAWSVYHFTREALTDELLERGKGITKNLVVNSRYGVLTQDRVILRDLLEGVIVERSVTYGRIYDETGRLLIEAYPEAVGDRPTPKANLPSPPSQLLVHTHILEDQSGDAVTEIITPVFPRKAAGVTIEQQLTHIFEIPASSEGHVAIGYVEVGFSHRLLNEKLTRLIWSYFAVILLVVVVGIVTSEVFVWFMLLPVKSIMKTAMEIFQGNMKKRVHVHHKDEIGELATIFNQMAQILSEREEELRIHNKKLESSNADLRHVVDELEGYKQDIEQKVMIRTEELAQKNILLRGAMERAQSADLLKTRFLANISHELRTPLNAIIGFTQLILDGVDGEINDVQKKDLSAIRQSGTQLLAIINDILDISRIEAGRIRLNREESDLSEIILDVMATAKPLIKSRDVALRLEAPPIMPKVYVDRIRVRQIILNLVSNAAKFTVKGYILVRVGLQNGDVNVSVTDTGMGIRQEDIPKLFNEFLQLDPLSTQSRGGTGLGLALAKRFTELHGGRIWVNSTYGAGSTFFVSIPGQVKALREGLSVEALG